LRSADDGAQRAGRTCAPAGCARRRRGEDGLSWIKASDLLMADHVAYTSASFGEFGMRA
jgi:hypothetical protein